MAIKIGIKQLDRELQKRLKKMPGVIKRGVIKAARDAKKILVKKTPVDTGHMKSSWEVKKTQRGAEVVNDAPHAGIIEGGARRHQVSREGKAAIAAWARRKLGVTEQEAEGIAWGVSKRLEREGIEGKFIARDSIPMLERRLQLWVEQEIRGQANKRA